MKFAGQLQWTDYLNAQLLHLKPKGIFRILFYVWLFVMVALNIWGLYILYLFAVGEWHSSLESILFIFLPSVVLLLSWLLFRYVSLPYQTKKIFTQQKEINVPFEMEITEDNLVAANEFGNAIRPWKNFVKWKENEELLLIYISNIMFVIIPKRLIADPKQLEMIKVLLQKNGIRAA